MVLENILIVILLMREEILIVLNLFLVILVIIIILLFVVRHFCEYVVDLVFVRSFLLSERLSIDLL